MATVSRFHAVAKINDSIQLSGFFAWLAWLGVHIVYLIGFKNRVTTLMHWAVTFIGRGRSERAATDQQVFARMALHREKLAIEPNGPRRPPRPNRPNRFRRPRPPSTARPDHKAPDYGRVAPT